MSLLERFYRSLASDAGKRVAALLRDHPSEWHSTDGYRLVNETRQTSIWICNSAYGLKVASGVGFDQEEIFPGWADRKLIHRHVKQFRIPTPEVFAQKRFLARITAVGDRDHNPTSTT